MLGTSLDVMLESVVYFCAITIRGSNEELVMKEEIEGEVRQGFGKELIEGRVEES